MPGYLTLSVIYIVLLAVVWFASKFAPILKDMPTTNQLAGKEVSYSLSRLMLTLWTVVVLGAIIYAFISTCVVSGVGCVTALSSLKIDPTILALIGISGGTGALSAAVDASKDSAALNAKTKAAVELASVHQLQETKAALDQTLPESRTEAVQTAAEQVSAEIDKKTEEVAAMKALAKRSEREPESTGFFSDILQDDNGNSVHRLQMLLFNLIAMAMFTASVYASKDATMPPVPEEVLALLGISNGTYLGLKLPGKGGL